MLERFCQEKIIFYWRIMRFSDMYYVSYHGSRLSGDDRESPRVEPPCMDQA